MGTVVNIEKKIDIVTIKWVLYQYTVKGSLIKDFENVKLFVIILLLSKYNLILNLILKMKK